MSHFIHLSTSFNVISIAGIHFAYISCCYVGLALRSSRTTLCWQSMHEIWIHYEQWRNERKHLGAQSLRGSEATRPERAGVGCGRGCPSSHGRELLHFSTWKCAIWGTPKKEILIWRHVLYVWNWKKHGLTLFGRQGAPKPPTTSTPVITKVPYWNSGLMHTQDTVLTIRCSWRPQGLPELAWPCKCMQSGYQR